MTTSIWQQINAAAAQSVDTVRRSLVQIVSQDGGIGAGTIWHEDGLVITNAHVVLGRHAQRGLQVITQDGEHYDATILATDAERDLAALAIKATNLPTIAVGHSTQLVPGQWLMAIGHPWGVLDSITAGIVIGTGDKLPEIGDQKEWIALDMKMRPGHSGGPLFNSAGEIVGINTLIRGPEVSFAVPVDEVKKFLKATIGTYTPATQPINTAEAPEAIVV